MKGFSAKAGIVFCFFWAASAAYPKADPGTLLGKVLFGYQGWFNCPGPGGGPWTHWSRGEPDAGSLSVDMYPDLSEFQAEDLCPANGMTIGG